MPPDAWTTIEVRDGEKGPLVVEGVKVRVLAKTEGGPDASEEVLVIFRNGRKTERSSMTTAYPTVPGKRH